MSVRKPPGFPLPLEQVRAGTAVTPRAPARPAGAVAAVPKQALSKRAVVNPQRHLHSGTAPSVPVGLGLDSEGVRARMVERLRRAGITDDTVLAAMSAVPRHRFVDTALANQAYEDTSLPIGAGQTISKPSVVAHMLALLREGRGAPGDGGLGKVLEIGSGCGYQAAVLSLLARQVISVERLRVLYDKARDNLAPLARHNLRLIHGDGMLGHAPSAPYDSIVAAACGDALPPAWLAQLAPGGRLVAPVARAGGQVLVVVDLHEGHFVHREVNAVLFVPLKSGFA